MPIQKRSTPSQRAQRPNGRKKTLVLDQDLLDRARRALGARTETETVSQALEGVVQREAQLRGLRELAELGPIDSTRIE